MNHFRKWLPWVIIAILVIMLIANRFTTGALQTGPRIGLVEINSPILSSRQIVKDLNYFAHRSDIDGILIRLDTPGGAVAASQEIFEKVKAISAGDLPIIASMGNVAASGGYYIAIGADSIVANPGTATGSIGVIMGYPIAVELLGKLGIDYQQITSGALKDAGSTFREPNEQDIAYFQSLINNLHDQFVAAVSDRRGMTLERVRELADGSVYSGVQAVENGLIDRLGTFEDAIRMVGEMSGIYGRPILVEPPRSKRGFMEFLFEDMEAAVPFLNTHIIPKYELN